LNETAAVAPVAREPGAPSPALAPPLLTATPTRSWSLSMGGETDTPSPPALAPHSATRAAVRQNAAAASPVGNDDAQRKAAPSPSSRSPMQGVSDPLRTGGTYAVQVTSERRATEARSGRNSQTSLAGASRSCAALILVRRASTTARWSVPLRQWKRRLECAAH